MRKRYAWPDFTPDRSPDDVLSRAVNVLPAGGGGYRPVKSLAAISEALPASFRGGAAFIAPDGTTSLLAGHANGLSRYAAGAWSSLLVGMSVADRWRFAQFGNAVVAVNGVDTKQVDLSAGTASDLADAPTGNGVAVVGGHVVISQADGDRLRVAWSALNDHTGWTPAVNQSGFEPMPTGGEVKGIAGGEYGVILQRFRLVRMELTGESTAPFQFQEITPNFGCAASNSIAQAGRTIFFLSDRGFVALDDGQAIRPIGNEKFDQAFRDRVSADDYDKLYAAVDPKRTVVIWGLPGTPGVVFGYNWALDRAFTWELPFAGFFAGYDSSTTLEELDALYPDIDAMAFSLDDPRFQGGDPRLYVATPGDEIGALSGPNLEATFSLGWLEPFPGQVTRMSALWPDTDAVGGVTCTVDARQRRGDGIGDRFGRDMQASGRAPLRARGRYVAVTVTHEAGSEWSYDRGFDLEADPGGVR